MTDVEYTKILQQKILRELIEQANRQAGFLLAQAQPEYAQRHYGDQQAS